MSLIAKEPEGSSIEPLAEGVYVGTCYLLADIGEQHNKMNDTWRQKIVIGWEINGETITIDGQEEPRTISNFYTNSLHEKSSLRKDLECWRGKKFTPEELAGFDLRKIVGTACQLQVGHYTNADGKTRATVKAIMALPRGFKHDPATQRIIFDLDTDRDQLEMMPKFVQNMVEKSKEYQEADASAEERPFDNDEAAAFDDLPEDDKWLS